jgi:TolA-binding protein
LPEIINYVLQLAQAVVPVLPNGQPNPAASVARDALIFYAEAVDDMFTKFKVPSNIKVASLVAALDLGIQEAQSGTAAQLVQAQGQLQQAQGQLQQTQGQVQQQGSQLEQLKAALEQAQAGMQQAQLEGFHLRRAFGGFSPGSESAIAGGPALTGSQAGMEGAGGTPGGPMG